ncbi:hypothetical protein HW452_05315 [Halomonas aquamarina]|uniref:Uncharacterized protein n=1 Tax=Vreelandella aquamarina TaxID=77097 RepID=A0ACC5VRP3_9GAMM|nr:hypothetical protein [Halomonas aquamarina]MBZ5486941.1 hypothetical protein [Halomonas aquamarina]
MNAAHIEQRAQRRAMGFAVGERPRIGSRFDPAGLRGKNAVRMAEYQRRREGDQAPLQIWRAP